MKITSCKNNYNIYKKDNKTVFGSGMTSQLMEQIQKADVVEISKKLTDKNIVTDFKGNKVVAWCCDKVVDIFSQLKKKSKVNLALPKQICVEDFNNLKVLQQGLIGFCTVFPSCVHLDNDNVTPERSLFFNSFKTERFQASENVRKYYDWNNISELTDVGFFSKTTSSSHFLYNIMHEFIHAAHEEHLEKNKTTDYPFFIYSHNNPEYLEEFNAKYKKLAQRICNYAGTNPFETIACEMPKRILDSLDSDLNLVSNPFKDSPYGKQSFLQKISSKNSNDEYFNMLKDFWEGNF